MKDTLKKYGSLIITIIGLLILICFALLIIPESQLPTVLQSSGLVAIISAFLGVVMTVAVTAILLGKQAETQEELLKKQSKNESDKDKDIKIYEKKIDVYSNFIDKMWNMIENWGGDGSSDERNYKDDEKNYTELKELRKICFQSLVFYLNDEQIGKIQKQIKAIDLQDDDTATKAAAEITSILQDSLNEKDNKKGDLLALFNSFKKNIEKHDADEKMSQNVVQQADADDIHYWHFNILDVEKQIAAFREKNWVLALIEYGEEWRTNLIKQVNPGDVIFLFKRGGFGYIGAFRAKEPVFKILEADQEYTDEEIAQFDIYGGLADGASLCSNLLVEPIAYNYKGVGYWSVRRRTIERMNDTEAVKFLLNRLNGNDLDEERLAGKGKLDDGEIVPVNNEYFSKIITQNNL